MASPSEGVEAAHRPWQTGVGVALRFDPLGHVRDSELEVFAEAVRTGADAARAPVGNRRDRHAQVGRQFSDIEQRRQVGQM
jgi:hypothetical protein